MARTRPVLRTTPSFAGRCVEEFEYLAQTTPHELLVLIDTELRADPVLLAQAAASLALSTTAQADVAAMLLRLTRHTRPFVREEALRGLSPFVSGNQRLEDEVRRVAVSDSSPGVRALAAEILSASA